MVKKKKITLYLIVLAWIAMGICIIIDNVPESIEGSWELENGIFRFNYTDYNNCKIIIDETFFGIYGEDQKKLAEYYINDKEIILMNDRNNEEQFAFFANDGELRMMDGYGQLSIFIKK